MNNINCIDIRDDTCPITFVRTKLALENMTPGQFLEVIGKGEEPRHNVPRAVRDQGHEIISVEDLENEQFRIIIRVNF